MKCVGPKSEGRRIVIWEEVRRIHEAGVLLVTGAFGRARHGEKSGHEWLKHKCGAGCVRVMPCVVLDRS